MSSEADESLRLPSVAAAAIAEKSGKTGVSQSGGLMDKHVDVTPPATAAAARHNAQLVADGARVVHNVRTIFDIPYVWPEGASPQSAIWKHRVDLYIPEAPKGPRAPTPRSDGDGAGAMPPAPEAQPSSPTASAAAGSASPYQWHHAEASTDGKRPVVVFVHGGGWKRFDRRSVAGTHGNVGRSLAERGYVAAVISYRLSLLQLRDLLLVYLLLGSLLAAIVAGSLIAVDGNRPTASSRIVYAVPLAFLVPVAVTLIYQPLAAIMSGNFWTWIRARSVRHPDHVQDAARAAAWVHRCIGAYGGDASDIAIMGQSAGGHIVAMMAVEPCHMRAAQAEVDARLRASGVEGFGPGLGGDAGRAALEAEAAAFAAGQQALIAPDAVAAVPSSSPASVSTVDSTSTRQSDSQHPRHSHSHPHRHHHAPHLRPSSFVCMSGVYDADHLTMQPEMEACHVWAYPWAFVRRFLFVHPAFGRHPSQWVRAFATGHCTNPGAVASLRLPPMLLLNAYLDLGLRDHTDMWQRQLAAGGVLHERYTFVGTDHLGSIIGIGRRGWAGEEAIVPVVVDFLGRMRAARRHATPDAASVVAAAAGASKVDAGGGGGVTASAGPASIDAACAAPQ